jgi:hypothetical protein
MGVFSVVGRTTCALNPYLFNASNPSRSAAPSGAAGRETTQRLGALFTR